MGEGDVSGAIPAGRRFELLEGEVRDLQRWAHDGPESVDQWRAELRGAFSLVKFALGTSVVSMILGLAAIVALAAGIARSAGA